MRTPVTFDHTENMFGHSYSYTHNGETHVVVANADAAWHTNNKRVTKPYFWFRAPTISKQALAQTLRNLSDLSHKFEFKLWQSDKGLDASLKIKDDMDAAQWAFSHTESWAKWSDAEEKAWLTEQRPRKLKIRKDGSVKVKVTVSTIQDV